MNKHLALLMAGGACVAACHCPEKKAAPAQRPNIVMFLIDDLGYNDFSCYRSTFYRTPTIDSLASEGMLMTDAYTACTVSSPTRAALMSGKYPARLHLTDWIQGWKYADAPMQIPDWRMYLPLEEKTVAEYLHDAGYATWHVGKWHLGDDEKYWAENQGFDVNIAGNFKGAPIKDNQGHKGYFSPYGLKRLEDGPDGEYLTDRLTNEAIALIDAAEPGRPFYLNLCHYAVHTPLDAPAELVDKYADLVDDDYPQKNPVYAGMIEKVDDSLREIIAALRRKGVLDNTLIVVTSDNGALAGVSPSLDLRAGKGSVFEGGVRVPMIFYWKGHIAAGSRSDAPVISVDMLPTFLDAAGLDAPKDVDGISVLPLLTGGEKQAAAMRSKLLERPIFWHYPHYHKGGATPYCAMGEGRWLLTHWYETDEYALYDLSSDLRQSTDLSEEYPAVRKRLIRTLDNWLEDVDAQFATFKE